MVGRPNTWVLVGPPLCPCMEEFNPKVPDSGSIEVRPRWAFPNLDFGCLHFVGRRTQTQVRSSPAGSQSFQTVAGGVCVICTNICLFGFVVLLPKGHSDGSEMEFKTVLICISQMVKDRENLKTKSPFTFLLLRIICPTHRP